MDYLIEDICHLPEKDKQYLFDFLFTYYGCNNKTEYAETIGKEGMRERYKARNAHTRDMTRGLRVGFGQITEDKVSDGKRKLFQYGNSKCK